MLGKGSGPTVEINTTVDASKSEKAVTDLMQRVSKSVDGIGGAISNYEKRVESLIKGLERITREGSNAGQTVRDLSLAGGGSSIAGRVRQSNARSKQSDMRQVEEVLAADIINTRAQILKNVAKSVRAATVSSLSSSKQEIASLDAEIRSAQIEAQRARAGFARQLKDSAGNRSGTITQTANSLGINNLGTYKTEQAALNKLLAAEAAYKEQIKLTNRELRDTEQLQGQIARMANGRLAPLRQQVEMLQKQNAIERENLVIAQAQARGDSGQVAKSRLKQEALRMDQMALRGVKEESVEYQRQVQLVRELSSQQEALNIRKRKSLQDTREQTQLEQSRAFASGNGGTRAEVMQNNIIGSRRVASSVESRASLLGMQGNLLMNYGLLGGGVAAIAGMAGAVVDLDAKLRELQAIAGATNGEFEGLRGVILKTSEDTKFSAVELAESATLLAQVGQSVTEIEQTLPVISAFAMAVGTDMKNAVDIVTTTLTVFNMGAQQTQRITNVLAEALNRSKLSMDQLTLGFQYAANIAADSGVTFEELTSALAGMSQAGIRSGSMLGTGLRQIMISLASPTDELRTLLSELGLSMSDVDIRSQGLTGVLKNFADAGLSAGQAMSVFETRTAAALIAATNQVDFMMQVQEGFANTRAAEIAAAAQSESFRNSMLELKNEFMSFMNDAARPILDILIDTSKSFKALDNSIGPAIPILKALTATLITFFAAAAIGGVARLGIEFMRFSGVLGGVSAALPLLSRAFSMTILSFQAGVGVVSSLRLAMTALAAAWLPLTVITGTAAAMVYFYTQMNRGETSARDFTKQLDDQKTAFNENKAAQDKYQQVLSQIDQTIARVRNRAAQLKDGSQELRIEVMNGAAAFNEYGAGIDANNTKLKDYIETLQVAKAAVIALAEEKAREAQGEAAQVVGTAQATFRGSFDRLKAMDRVNNPFLTRDVQNSGKLTPQEFQNFTKFMTELKELQQMDTRNMSSGDLNNFMTNAAGMIEKLTKADPAKFKSLIDSLNAARFDAASLSSARSTLTTAANEVSTIAMAQTPAYRGFSDQLLRRAEPLTSFGSTNQAIARNNRGNAGEQFRQTDAALASYSRDYRSMEAAAEGARSTFGYENRSIAEKAAFDLVMKPVEDILVQIREQLISTGKGQNEIAASSLELMAKVLEDAPNTDFSRLRQQMVSLGFNPTGNDTTELRQWIMEEQGRRANNNNVDSMIGRTSTRRVLEQGIEADYLRQNGPVAARERIPVAQRIRDMATQYGLSPDLMRTIASIESDFKTDAVPRDPSGRVISTARGLFQPLAGTWNARRPNEQVSDRISNVDPNDPRFNAEKNMVFAMEEMTDRMAQMTANLGRRPEDWELYLAWQQGVGGATSILKNPNASLAGTAGRRAADDNAGAGMTNGQFAENWRRKYAERRGQASTESTRDIGEAAEALAGNLRKATETVGEAARVSSTTARALITRTMRNLDENTTDEDGFSAVAQIENSLREVQDGISLFYDSKIAANRKFKADMDAAGRLTPEKAQQLDQELQELNTSFDNEMERVREDTISTFSDLYKRLPQFLGSIKKTIDSVNLTVSELQIELDNSEPARALRRAEARDEVFTDVDNRGVASGRISSAYANARGVLRGQTTRNTQDAYDPAQLTTRIMQQAAIRAGLDRSIGYSNMTINDVTASRVAEEETKLSGMNKNNTDASTLGKQVALVETLNTNLAAANELRAQYAQLDDQILAGQEAQQEAMVSTEEQLRTMIQAWGIENGTFSSLLNDSLAAVPGVLDTVSGSFSTFFSDIMSGTASVGDAFKTMASSILKSMMDIVASAAAKQLMRMVVNIGMSLFGGGGSFDASTMTTSGFSNTSFNGGGWFGGAPTGLREGGFIRAATGMAVRGRDSVPILGMPGEYMLRKSAVDAIGVDNLDRINAQGNRVMSSGVAAQPVTLNKQPQANGQPLSIYVVSPDKTPPPSKDQIVVMVQEDMINRGPVYKAVKAVQSGAI